ncbi:MAG: hypothetical protein DUD33_08385 [Coriobacteriaceae bacterium]|jgi:hypothetical protein|nr:hypothetical protein [Olsenella sp.]RRF89154.1 MAG: hypothetical protein DUD33_08385 [Coriobacteriaceae bacterium]
MMENESCMLPVQNAAEYSNPLGRAFYSLGEDNRANVMIVAILGITVVLGLAVHGRVPLRASLGNAEVAINCT